MLNFIKILEGSRFAFRFFMFHRIKNSWKLSVIFGTKSELYRFF